MNQRLEGSVYFIPNRDNKPLLGISLYYSYPIIMIRHRQYPIIDLVSPMNILRSSTKLLYLIYILGDYHLEKILQDTSSPRSSPGFNREQGTQPRCAATWVVWGRPSCSTWRHVTSHFSGNWEISPRNLGKKKNRNWFNWLLTTK